MDNQNAEQEAKAGSGNGQIQPVDLDEKKPLITTAGWGSWLWNAPGNAASSACSVVSSGANTVYNGVSAVSSAVSNGVSTVYTSGSNAVSWASTKMTEAYNAMPTAGQVLSGVGKGIKVTKKLLRLKQLSQEIPAAIGLTKESAKEMFSLKPATFDEITVDTSDATARNAFIMNHSAKVGSFLLRHSPKIPAAGALPAFYLSFKTHKQLEENKNSIYAFLHETTQRLIETIEIYQDKDMQSNIFEPLTRGIRNNQLPALPEEYQQVLSSLLSMVLEKETKASNPQGAKLDKMKQHLMQVDALLGSCRKGEATIPLLESMHDLLQGYAVKHEVGLSITQFMEFWAVRNWGNYSNLWLVAYGWHWQEYLEATFSASNPHVLMQPMFWHNFLDVMMPSRSSRGFHPGGGSPAAQLIYFTFILARAATYTTTYAALYMLPYTPLAVSISAGAYSIYQLKRLGLQSLPRLVLNTKELIPAMEQLFAQVLNPLIQKYLMSGDWPTATRAQRRFACKALCSRLLGQGDQLSEFEKLSQNLIANLYIRLIGKQTKEKITPLIEMLFGLYWGFILFSSSDYQRTVACSDSIGWNLTGPYFPTVYRGATRFAGLRSYDADTMMNPDSYFYAFCFQITAPFLYVLEKRLISKMVGKGVGYASERYMTYVAHEQMQSLIENKTLIHLMRKHIGATISGYYHNANEQDLPEEKVPSAVAKVMTAQAVSQAMAFVNVLKYGPRLVGVDKSFYEAPAKLGSWHNRYGAAMHSAITFAGSVVKPGVTACINRVKQWWFAPKPEQKELRIVVATSSQQALPASIPSVADVVPAEGKLVASDRLVGSRSEELSRDQAYDLLDIALGSRVINSESVVAYQAAVLFCNPITRNWSPVSMQNRTTSSIRIEVLEDEDFLSRRADRTLARLLPPQPEGLSSSDLPRQEELEAPDLHSFSDFMSLVERGEAKPQTLPAPQAPITPAPVMSQSRPAQVQRQRSEPAKLFSSPASPRRPRNPGLTTADFENKFKEEIPDAAFKQEIIRCFGQYIKRVGICFFRLACAHHHNDRAKAVKQAMLKAKTMGEIEAIYLNQMNLFNEALGLPQLAATPLNDSLLSKRYSQFSELHNRPRDKGYMAKSTYIKALTGIKDKLSESRNHYVSAKTSMMDSNPLLRSFSPSYRSSGNL